jgi:hypothetical protein
MAYLRLANGRRGRRRAEGVTFEQPGIPLTPPPAALPAKVTPRCPGIVLSLRANQVRFRHTLGSEEPWTIAMTDMSL